MNVTIRTIQPTTTEPETWLGSPPQEPVNLWEEEEVHGDFGSGQLAGRGRRLWIAIALVAVVAGLGFVGRFGQDAGAPGSRPGSGPAAMASHAAILPFSVTTPAEDATMEGSVVEVRGVATEAVGLIHLGVVVGGAVIGWSTVHAEEPGPWSASIPIYAPPAAVEAQLLGWASPPGVVAPRTAFQMRAAAAIVLPLAIHSNGPIEVWPVATHRSGQMTSISVAGSAPLTVGRLTVALADSDGRRLASQDAPVIVDDARPGSGGGHALGLGSFAVELTLGSPIREGPLRVLVDWRDVIGGEWGTSVLTLPAEPSEHPVGSSSP